MLTVCKSVGNDYLTVQCGLNDTNVEDRMTATRLGVERSVGHTTSFLASAQKLRSFVGRPHFLLHYGVNIPVIKAIQSSSIRYTRNTSSSRHVTCCDGHLRGESWLAAFSVWVDRWACHREDQRPCCCTLRWRWRRPSRLDLHQCQQCVYHLRLWCLRFLVHDAQKSCTKHNI